jgi:adenine deaminase
VRLAVEGGVSEIDALVMATINPAEYHGFTELGALGPGYQADILCFDTLAGFRPSRVFQRGRLVARDGAAVPGAVPDAAVPDFMRHSVHLETPPSAASFDYPLRPGARVRTIGIREGSLTTTSLVTDPSDPGAQVVRLAVVERHHHTGRIGLGWVQGFGLTHGALASTVGHDAHNCMAVGAATSHGPAAMAAAVARLAEIGGGQVAVDDHGQVLAELRLPIGGLMSDQRAQTVVDGLHDLVAAARTLGTSIGAPFMHMSFLGLSVIPELRLTDKGLVDVGKFALVPVAVD